MLVALTQYSSQLEEGSIDACIVSLFCKRFILAGPRCFRRNSQASIAD